MTRDEVFQGGYRFSTTRDGNDDEETTEIEPLVVAINEVKGSDLNPKKELRRRGIRGVG